MRPGSSPVQHSQRQIRRSGGDDGRAEESAADDAMSDLHLVRAENR
jgi:hypothetical protein